jgi:hypothetical protein
MIAHIAATSLFMGAFTLSIYAIIKTFSGE